MTVRDMTDNAGTKQ